MVLSTLLLLGLLVGWQSRVLNLVHCVDHDKHRKLHELSNSLASDLWLAEACQHFCVWTKPGGVDSSPGCILCHGVKGFLTVIQKDEESLLRYSQHLQSQSCCACVHTYPLCLIIHRKQCKLCNMPMWRRCGNSCRSSTHSTGPIVHHDQNGCVTLLIDWSLFQLKPGRHQACLTLILAATQQACFSTQGWVGQTM